MPHPKYHGGANDEDYYRLAIEITNPKQYGWQRFEPGKYQTIKIPNVNQFWSQKSHLGQTQKAATQIAQDQCDIYPIEPAVSFN